MEENVSTEIPGNVSSSDWWNVSSSYWWNVSSSDWWNGSSTLCAGNSDILSDPADDAIWILTSTFIIFTMQSGFGLLESGSVTTKNEVNIMMKNAIDVIVGGFTYWIFGYAFSFGQDPKMSNAFSGWGYFFVDVEESKIGEIYAHFFFQSSFATTATTIVSGAMAERTKLEAYILFSFANTLVFVFPAHWVWANNGFLHTMGIVDIAGDGPVHLVGGVTGLVATLLLKPRHKRYESAYPPAMGSPTNAMLGMFMLWWGWLGFNCGSTFGISGPKWKLAARSAVATLCSSIAGGLNGLTLSSAVNTFLASCAGGVVGLGSSYLFKNRKFDVGYMINGILSSLVAITAHCALASPWEGFLIGLIGSALALMTIELLDSCKIDDPVGVVGVHAVSASWGLIAVGLFARKDDLRHSLGICHDYYGVFYGGGWSLLGIQSLGVLCIATWTFVTSFILLKAVDLTVGLRMSLQHEILGADIIEHAVGDVHYDKRGEKVVNMCKRPEEPDTSQWASQQDGQPRFNEARKRRRQSIDVMAMANAEKTRTMCPSIDSGLPSVSEDVSNDNKYMWKLAVGKVIKRHEEKRKPEKRLFKTVRMLSNQNSQKRRGENGHISTNAGHLNVAYDNREVPDDVIENSFDNNVRVSDQNNINLTLTPSSEGQGQSDLHHRRTVYKDPPGESHKDDIDPQSVSIYV